MKTFKYKTLRSYIGAKCRQEGGKSQAKIHDALQIANLIADDLFEQYLIDYPDDDVSDIIEWASVNATDLFLKTGAKRYLQRMKKVNKKERK